MHATIFAEIVTGSTTSDLVLTSIHNILMYYDIILVQCILGEWEQSLWLWLEVGLLPFTQS